MEFILGIKVSAGTHASTRLIAQFSCDCEPKLNSKPIVQGQSALLNPNTVMWLNDFWVLLLVHWAGVRPTGPKSKPSLEFGNSRGHW